MGARVSGEAPLLRAQALSRLDPAQPHPGCGRQDRLPVAFAVQRWAKWRVLRVEPTLRKD